MQSHDREYIAHAPRIPFIIFMACAGQAASSHVVERTRMSDHVTEMKHRDDRKRDDLVERIATESSMETFAERRWVRS